MKKISFYILSLILFLGPFSTAIAQKLPTICAVHPFTGRFAFAGIEGSAAMQDVVDMTNEEGGINGKKIQYYWADGEYKDDVGIAAFKRLYAQYTPQVMFGQSTGMTKALGPEIKSRYQVLYSAYTMTSEAANPKENPYLFIAAPTYAEQFGVLLKHIAKEKPGARGHHGMSGAAGWFPHTDRTLWWRPTLREAGLADSQWERTASRPEFPALADTS